MTSSTTEDGPARMPDEEAAAGREAAAGTPSAPGNEAEQGRASAPGNEAEEGQASDVADEAQEPAAPEDLEARPGPAPGSPWPRLLLWLGALGVVILAVVEATVALTAPWRVPRDADWRQAAAYVRQLKQPGDVILFAPRWVDPVGRLHLGDVITVAEEARMDEARYRRLIEVAVRGARAPETQRPGVELGESRRFGRVDLRVYRQQPAEVVFDFLKQWRTARVSRWRHGREEARCLPQADRIQCPGIGFNHVALRVLEPDYRARRCLYVQPVGRAEVRISFQAALGSTLALRTGLHDYHQRKIGRGSVNLEILVDGQSRGRVTHGPDDGWKPTTIDTAALAGEAREVTFVVTSEQPYARHFCFAAEARK